MRHGARLDDPVRTKPTTAKQKTPVPEEKYEEQKSLERYELEKRTKLLINLPGGGVEGLVARESV